jgi:hypothetical protein
MLIRVQDNIRRSGDSTSQTTESTLYRARHHLLHVMTTILVLLVTIPCAARNSSKGHPAKPAENATPILWLNPSNIRSRDLFYGPGGEAHAPHSTYTFIREDLNGTNPKFVVRDENGVEWKVKLGPEAKPETVASRLLWAAGYFTNENYFLADFRVANMQPLKRGGKLIAPDGTMHNVRLKRYVKEEKKIGDWNWRHNPFNGTREFNGLRVMMALFNNWDLKNENNSTYEEHDKSEPRAVYYVVSDLGASFGTTGLSYPDSRSKGNLPAYSQSKFIKGVHGQYVDFNVPTRPNLFHLVNPKEFITRMRLRWIGRHIPRADARWMGELLSQLSKEQIRQAFRAADYSPQQVEEFTNVVAQRIEELRQL